VHLKDSPLTEADLPRAINQTPAAAAAAAPEHPTKLHQPASSAAADEPAVVLSSKTELHVAPAAPAGKPAAVMRRPTIEIFAIQEGVAVVEAVETAH